MIFENVKIKTQNIPDSFSKDAVYALIQRIAGDRYAKKIELERSFVSDGFDEYEIFDCGDKILIRANSSLSAVSAFNRYLKDCCGFSVGVLTTSGTLPELPPVVGERIYRKSKFLYRYFFNYCAFGYTYAFDTWSDWEKTLDYLLLSGYNLILNPIAVESVWRKALLSIGYEKKDADGFLCGPAFYPWQWMLNLSGWAGGAPEWWYDFREELAGQFNERLQSFGVGIVGVGYCGQIPADFHKYFPDSKIIDQGNWFGFVRPAFILPSDANYDKMADAYYREFRKIKGAENIHYYATDPFHEGGKTNEIDLAEYGKGNFEKMRSVDEKAVWVIQGWSEPQKEIIDAIPYGRQIIVALCGDFKELNEKSYYGAPWISCAVNLFGGQHNLSGNLENLSERPFQYLSKGNINIVGIGYMPESVNCCEIFFETVAENAFRDEKTGFDDYLRHYITTKYGKYNENLHIAWRMMADNVLCKEFAMINGSGLLARPALDVCRVSSWEIKARPYLNQTPLIEIAERLFDEYETLKTSNAYKKDLLDVVRQLVANISWYFIEELKKSYFAKDLDGVSKNGQELLGLFDLQTALLSTDPSRMVGTWLEKAKALGKTPAEKAYFEWNARVQITLWGDETASAWLRDYAAKEWQGMLEDFYKPRWESFISRLEISLLTGKELLPIQNYHEELPFVYQKKRYPTQPSGDLKEEVSVILEKVKSVRVIPKEEKTENGSFIDNVFQNV